MDTGTHIVMGVALGGLATLDLLCKVILHYFMLY